MEFVYRIKCILLRQKVLKYWLCYNKSRMVAAEIWRNAFRFITWTLCKSSFKDPTGYENVFPQFFLGFPLKLVSFSLSQNFKRRKKLAQNYNCFLHIRTEVYVWKLIAVNFMSFPWVPGNITKIPHFSGSSLFFVKNVNFPGFPTVVGALRFIQKQNLVWKFVYSFHTWGQNDFVFYTKNPLLRLGHFRTNSLRIDKLSTI